MPLDISESVGFRRGLPASWQQRHGNFRLPPSQVPRRLYRVQYAGCATSDSPTHGLLDATFHHPMPSDLTFEQAVQDHLSRQPDYPSPFISLFEDEQHADNWARGWSTRHGGREYEVLVIDTGFFDQFMSVFYAEELAEQLELWLPEGAMGGLEDEFLVAGGIPGEAIVGGWSWGLVGE